MNIRGERECTECGTRWSYFETGSVGCPACGSLRSVGTGERSSHTDRPTDFDLTAVRGMIDDCSSEELADRARAACREYLRNRGFVSGGRLRELDEAYLAAAELNHVADLVARTSQPTEDEELYFLALLRGADAGERPAAETIPASFREGRGLAVADSIRDYRRDIRLWIEETDRTLSDAARSTLEILIDHETRLRMLDGDVDPGTAETMLEAARHLGNGVRGDEYELEQAQERLETVF